MKAFFETRSSSETKMASLKSVKIALMVKQLRIWLLIYHLVLNYKNWSDYSYFFYTHEDTDIQ